MVSSRLRRIYPFLWAGLLGLALVACNARTPTTNPVATAQDTPVVLPTPTALPPSPTPKTDLVLLLAPPGADSSLVSRLQALVEELAGKSGLRFQMRPELSPQEMQQTAVVVAVPPEADLAKLVSTYPRVHFLAVGFSGLEPAANLIFASPQSLEPSQLGFLAGYIAAAITTDWRVAVITAADAQDGKSIRQGFINGVFYFCGLCRPVYPPFPTSGYPITIEIPAGNSPADWDAVLTQLQSWQVSTAFIDPALSDEKFISVLAEGGINLILPIAPPAGIRTHWVASLGSTDALQAVRTLWPDLVKGNQVADGAALDSAPGITDSNPDLLSPGRKHLVEEMLKDLLAGYIDPGVKPGG